MKKVLITGNSGYIGSHLSTALENKYELYGLDKKEPTIKVKFLQADITTPISIGEEFDCVVHLAAKVNVGESTKMPTLYYDTNISGTLNVLRGIKTKNFIFASTGAAVQCESPYGVSKRAAEDCVFEYCTKNNIDHTVFRFYNVIGGNVVPPTNPDGLFYNLLRAPEIGYFSIFGKDYDTRDGTCMRDYVHVMEICEAIKTAIDKPSGQLENLGHGVGYTVKEMVNMFKEVNNVDFDVRGGSRREGDVGRSVLDNPSKYMKSLYKIKDLLKVDK
jgi:UDP-glucose 4-epimerase